MGSGRQEAVRHGGDEEEIGLLATRGAAEISVSIRPFVPISLLKET
jgi:hypothetical protein